VVKARNKIASIIYILYGLINVMIFAKSNFFLMYMCVLGILCCVTGFFLWIGKLWAVNLAIISGLLTLTVGITTLYASVGFVGFSPNLTILLLHIALIGYAILALILSFYVTMNRQKFLDS